MDLSLFKFRIPIHLRWSDLDALNHVNNSKYLTYVEEARTKYLAEIYQWNWQENAIILAHASVDFIAAIEGHHSPEVLCRVSRLGSKSFDMEYLILQGTHLFAKAKCVMVFFDYQAATTQLIPDHIRNQFIEYEGSHLS